MSRGSILKQNNHSQMSHLHCECARPPDSTSCKLPIRPSPSARLRLLQHQQLAQSPSQRLYTSVPTHSLTHDHRTLKIGFPLRLVICRGTVTGYMRQKTAERLYLIKVHQRLLAQETGNYDNSTPCWHHYRCPLLRRGRHDCCARPT